MGEDISAVFVTRGDAAPVVQVAKDVFDAVSLAVEALIVGNWPLRFLRGGMPRCLGPSRSQWASEALFSRKCLAVGRWHKSTRAPRLSAI